MQTLCIFTLIYYQNNSHLKHLIWKFEGIQPCCFLPYKASTLSLTFLPFSYCLNLFICVDHWWIFQPLSWPVAVSESMRSYCLEECSSGRPPAQSYSQEVWLCTMALGLKNKLWCFNLYNSLVRESYWVCLFIYWIHCTDLNPELWEHCTLM